MTKGNKMTENKFTAIKLLLKSGATQKEAAEYLDVSLATVYRVHTAETFEEYKNALAVTARAMAAKRKDNKPAGRAATETPGNAPKQPVQTIEAQHPATVQLPFYVMEQLRKTNELLTGISQKLAYIVEDLYGTGKKEC